MPATKASSAFPTLLSPLHRGRLKLKNRIIFPAHQTLFSEDSVVGPRMRAYYVERAKGGAGAVVIEGGATHDTTIKFPNYIHAHDPRIVKSLDELAAGLRPYGCVGIVQIVHSGSRMSSHDARRALWAPSNVKSAISPEFPHAMTRADIAELMAGYDRTARHVGQSAIDGIEVHACHEYLFGQFLSPLNNLRDDDYGGSLENRARLLLDVLKIVRRAIGDDKLFGVRLNGSDLTPGGLDNDDYIKVAKMVEATGVVDYLSITAGTSRDNNMIVPPMDVPHGIFVDYAAAIRKAVKLPVFTVGRIKTPEFAEQILASGQADAVNLARALIADPFWVEKAARAPAEIRPCIGCNQGCFGYLYTNRPITCTVNPAVGRELELGAGTAKPAKPARRVLVVGGGPAGMEAAIAAAERGHTVVLAEASTRLGGQVRIAGAHPLRKELLEIIDHQVIELKRLGVEVRTGTALNAAAVRAVGADVVIMATGSVPPERPLKSDGSVPVRSPADVVESALVDPGQWRGRKVTIVDSVAHFQAYAPAFALADAGAEVVIVTAKLHAASLLDNGSMTNTLRRLAEKRVRIEAQVATVEVRAGAVQLRHIFTGEVSSIASDYVVAATGNIANDRLARELADAAGSAPQVLPQILVGDCEAPRTMLDGIREGRMAGRAV